jgi:hypothetical protein
MNSLAKTSLIAFLVSFFTIQFYLTVFGGFLWPFSSHRLFSQSPSPQKEIVRAIVTDSAGNISEHHPGRVIPIEYSRCSGLIRKMAKEGSPEQKETFCAYLKNRLNTKPWVAFDEMYSAASPTDGACITKVHFETHLIQFVENNYPNSIQTLEVRELLP